MVCLLLYAYCVGVFSSRKIAPACERNLAFLAIVGDDRPDFRTISDFRKLHLDAFTDIFIQSCAWPTNSGHGAAGQPGHRRHQDAGQCLAAQGHELRLHGKEEERLRAEIDALLQQAQDTDGEEDAALGSRRGDELPAELQRREQRLATIAAAKQRLEEQAEAEAEAERQRRAEAEAERQRRGRSGGARNPSRSANARRQGPDELHRPRIEGDDAEQQGLGLRGNAQSASWTRPVRSSWPAT